MEKVFIPVSGLNLNPSSFKPVVKLVTITRREMVTGGRVSGLSVFVFAVAAFLFTDMGTIAPSIHLNNVWASMVPKPYATGGKRMIQWKKAGEMDWLFFRNSFGPTPNRLANSWVKCGTLLKPTCRATLANVNRVTINSSLARCS